MLFCKDGFRQHDRVVTRLVAPILQGKANQIATQIGADVSEFSIPKGWLQKWKQRNNVQSYKINGESGNVDLVGAEQWKSSLTTMFTASSVDHRKVEKSLPIPWSRHEQVQDQIYLDEYFKRKVRKVLPFLDNAPVHIVNETTDLTNVEFCYFPPNLTSYQFFSLLMLALSKV
ncbi:hypothetical protein BASA83_003022 [Batrachochytrium salamandrivorans]|nr:hypothetical protein BASA83_003022 [Batrachochytrium salamandrivorans]